MWQPQAERAAFAGLAIDGELAVHHLSETAADRETETGAAVRPGVAAHALDERLEDVADLVGRDAAAGVGDADTRPRTCRVVVVMHTRMGPRTFFPADRHETAGRGELDRIRQQVQQDLLHALTVSVVQQVG